MGKTYDTQPVKSSSAIAAKAMSRKEYNSTELQIEHALTPEEKEICQNIVTHGVTYLRHTKGWKAEASKRFLSRSEVQREIATLKSYYEDRAGIQERTQFLAQLRINGMVPAAIGILARSLRGAYKSGDGQDIEPPTKMQLDAAVQVLDRSNVQGTAYKGNDNTPSIDARAVNLALGQADNGASMAQLDSASRDKVRSVLAAVVQRSRAVADADSQLAARKSVRDSVGKLHTSDEDDEE